MSRYQQADGSAAEALVERLSPKLYPFFLSQRAPRAEADDMLQEFWLRIHRVRHTYRPGAALLPWVYAIASRVRVDNYRKRRRVSREIGADALSELAGPRREAGGACGLEDLLASLPDSQREVLTLLSVDGLSIEEIAQATFSTTGAVKQKAHRAYARLRALFQVQGHPQA